MSPTCEDETRRVIAFNPKHLMLRATVPFHDLDLILHGIELEIALPSDESL